MCFDTEVKMNFIRVYGKQKGLKRYLLFVKERKKMLELFLKHPNYSSNKLQLQFK